MNLNNTFPNGFSITSFDRCRFYENKPFFTFTFTNLSLWQILETKRFVKQVSHVLFLNYGYNCDTQKGSGTVSVSKLKKWTKNELQEFEEIMGTGTSSFWLFL